MPKITRRSQKDLQEAPFVQPDAQDEEEFVSFKFKPSRFYSTVIPIAFLLGLWAGYTLWGSGTSAALGLASQDTPSSQDNTRYDIPILNNDPAFGPEDAAITIIEFSDFECPFCRRFFLDVLPQIKAAYPDQIRFVYKDLPLSGIHPNAVPAAEAALCAQEQGMFWEFHDLLFGMRLELGPEAYLEYAAELDLDMDEFELCVEERRYADEVSADYAFASQLGVRSTPTFFINGIAVLGALPFEEFARVIDFELDNLE